METTQETPMKTELVPTPEPMKLTAAEVIANVQLIQQVLKKVFKKGVHFDIVPGCGPKEVLLKPGAEYIMVLFRLSGEPQIDDLSSEDEIRYRVRVRVTHQVARNEVGWGVGEASSNETKYKWIKAEKFVWDETPEDRRRKVWKQGQQKPYSVMQVRANISDVANTVLKMAKKRALVDATLTCTAASDVFNQDIEDMPDELRQNVAETARPPMPQRASEKAAPPVSADPQDDSYDSTEDPPPPPPQRKPGLDLSKAERFPAKYDAPCKLCKTMMYVGQPILYVRTGYDKGGYCASHAG